MSFASVDITIGQGIGAQAALNDGVCGYVVSGVAIVGDSPWALGEAKSFRSLDAVKAAGLDEAYDTANSTNAYRQIREHYEAAGNGAKVWVMIVPKTESLADIVDPDSTNHYARTLVEQYAQYEINMLGACRVPDSDPGNTGGFDDDALAAIAKATLLRNYLLTKVCPVRIMIEGRDMVDVDTLPNLTLRTDNAVAVCLCSTEKALNGGSTHDKSASVGLALGAFAALPVQRKNSRVKNGSIPGIVQAYFSDGSTLEETDAESAEAKGFIVMRKHSRKAGYYWASDITATATSDDYTSFARGRVIDKAFIYTYLTFVEELDDEITLNTDGTGDPAELKELESAVENAIGTAMAGEISSVDAYIDSSQDIGTTNQIEIQVGVVPLGYKNKIIVPLSFKLG